MKSITLTLPWSPSANTFYRSRIVTPKKGKPFASTYISNEGREFYNKVSHLLAEKEYPKLAGPLFVFIELHPPTHRKQDVDNRNKPILDALKYRDGDKDQILDTYIFADDDSQVKFLMTCLLDVVTGGRVVVHIKQINMNDFYRKIKYFFLDDDCPDADGKVYVPNLPFEAEGLFD